MDPSSLAKKAGEQKDVQNDLEKSMWEMPSPAEKKSDVQNDLSKSMWAAPSGGQADSKPKGQASSGTKDQTTKNKLHMVSDSCLATCRNDQHTDNIQDPAKTQGTKVNPKVRNTTSGSISGALKLTGKKSN